MHAGKCGAAAGVRRVARRGPALTGMSPRVPAHTARTTLNRSLPLPAMPARRRRRRVGAAPRRPGSRRRRLLGVARHRAGQDPALTGARVLLPATDTGTPKRDGLLERDGAATPAVPPQLQPSPEAAAAGKRPAEEEAGEGREAAAGAAAGSPASAKRQRLEGDEEMAEMEQQQQQLEQQAVAASPRREQEQQQAAAVGPPAQLALALAETQAVSGLSGLSQDGGHGDTAEQEQEEEQEALRAALVLPPTQVRRGSGGPGRAALVDRAGCLGLRACMLFYLRGLLLCSPNTNLVVMHRGRGGCRA